MNNLEDMIVRQELVKYPHLRDIAYACDAEVEFPTEVDVEHELALKRLYSVHDYSPLSYRDDDLKQI